MNKSKTPWRKSGQVARTSGRRLQRQRDALFSREPLCRVCARQGLATVATIRDHIVPLFEGGSDDDGNVQPLCQACSNTKSAAEALRARGGMARLGAACDASGLPVNPRHPWAVELRGGGEENSPAPGPETDGYSSFATCRNGQGGSMPACVLLNLPEPA